MVEDDRVPLHGTNGRVLAEAVTAPRDVPLTDNAAVDGYAFAHADYLARDGRFEVSGRIAAGHPLTTALMPGTAARIFTGAVMPAGADSVAMQEDCEVSEKGAIAQVVIPPGLKAGANRRRAGEDVKAGDVILRPGTVLRPQDIAAAASLGQGTLLCKARLRVAVFSTGDELVEPGAAIREGQVYDSNRAMLKALAVPLGVTVSDLGSLPDSYAAVETALSAAARDHEVLITSGGASRGEEDHVINVLGALGERHMWQLAIKPGRPMTFGRIGDAAFFGLPGNPVAAFVCFLLYVRPALFQLQGANWQEPARFPLPAAFEIAKKKPDRREFLRGILTEQDGVPAVTKFSRDGSGLITGLREADGLVEVAEEVTEVRAGDTVAFIPFSEFGI